MDDTYDDIDAQVNAPPHSVAKDDSYADLDKVVEPTSRQPSFGEKTNAFIRSASNAATFGLADRFASLFPSWVPGGGDMKYQRQQDKEADEGAPYVSIAGKIAGSMLPASRIARGLQSVAPGYFVGAGVAPLARTGAATGAAMSGADDVLHGDSVDPVKMAASGALSGAAGVGGGIIGKFLGGAVPPVLRSSGQGLSAADKARMTDLTNKADLLGVRLSIPEAADAAAPGSSGGVVGAMRSATNSPGGATAQYNFFRGRQQDLRDTTNLINSGHVPPSFTAPGQAQSALREVTSAIAPANRQPFIDLPNRGDAGHTFYHDFVNRGMDYAKSATARGLLNSDNIEHLGTNSPLLSAAVNAGVGAESEVMRHQYPLPPFSMWNDPEAIRLRRERQ